MRGVHAILYALFDAEEGMDRDLMRRQVDLCLEAGVAGIAALGLASEGTKLSFAERLTMMTWVAEDVAGKAPLGVGFSLPLTGVLRTVILGPGHGLRLCRHGAGGGAVSGGV